MISRDKEKMYDLLHTNLALQTQSVFWHDEIQYGLAATARGKRLAVLGESIPDGFDGEASELGGGILLLCQPSEKNAAKLRQVLPWLQPCLLGLKTSAGMGDRIGLATPGHVRAVRATGSRIAPIFAQQSIREMARTIRTPQEVIDSATWGMLAEGWQEGAGADADHLKVPADIDACLAAGFTFFTIDPGAYVDNRAETASPGELGELAAMLPDEIRPQKSGLKGKTFDIEGNHWNFDEATLLRAAVKYGRAVAHVAGMYRHLEKAAGGRVFELEVSVDETDQPTSHAEHVYVASELQRLGVQWVSLAPRFVGSFEKGVDYIGDLKTFEDHFAGHAAIARAFGGYKLSLHSGSDKFSIYPIAARLTNGLLHLKTAGTSYLEALRTIGAVDPGLFREIYIFACERYETDRTSYHVSAEVQRAPKLVEVRDWPGLLDHFDGREILHVTFGSVLTEKDSAGKKRFYDRILTVLNANAEAYACNLEKHFIRHLEPFLQQE